MVGVIPLLAAVVTDDELEAGEEPFDEACSRLWWDLAAHFGPTRLVAAPSLDGDEHEPARRTREVTARRSTRARSPIP